MFGRDEELDLDDMHHIHLAMNEATQKRWAKAKVQFKRTTSTKEPENDFWLIYAHDNFRDEYLLLTIVGPEAHSRKQWSSYLRTILITIVEPWILGRISYPEVD